MPKLIARNGDRKGTEYLLERRTFVLGRGHKCDITVPSVKASRKHAEVYFENGAFRLKDLGSSNGTLLNERRIQETVVLQSGDRLQIGHNVLEFFDENAPTPIRVVSDAPVASPAAAGREPAEAPAPDAGPPARGMSGNDRDLLVVGLVLIVVLTALGIYMLVRSQRASSGAAPTAAAESDSPG